MTLVWSKTQYNFSLCVGHYLKIRCAFKYFIFIRRPCSPFLILFTIFLTNKCGAEKRSSFKSWCTFVRAMKTIENFHSFSNKNLKNVKSHQKTDNSWTFYWYWYQLNWYHSWLLIYILLFMLYFRKLPTFIIMSRFIIKSTVMTGNQWTVENSLQQRYLS